jgi:hypothetical protein
MDRQNAPGHPMIVIPMTPVAESIPITVSTEIAVIAVPTHHRRRRPEPRAFNPGGVVRLRLDGNRQSVVGRVVTTRSWGRFCGRQTGRSGPGGGLGFGAARRIALRTPVPDVLADYSWLWEEPIEKLTLAHQDALLTLHDDPDLAACGSNGGPAPGDANE